IDAGATDIRIDIDNDGIGLIRVRDNGHGIHKDDLELALLSHATSKIRQQSDLHHITSLGFRGEALSSIASVAQFQLTSRQQGVEQAWQIWKDPFSSANELKPASHPVGTTVEVKNLFYATPARRKFLKSGKTEFLHILEMVRRIAMSRFIVSIRLLHNDKQLFHCRADPADPGTLIKSVLGTDFGGNARRLDFTAGDMRLWGWLGTAAMARSQMDRQYLYFNGRMIRDKQINHAIRMAYADSLPPGRYPIYVLYLEAPPTAADVNVHPTKHEIRFKRSRDVHDFIYSALRQTLDQELSPVSDSGGITGVGAKPGSFTTYPRSPGVSEVREPPHYYRLLSAVTPAGNESIDTTALGSPLVQLHDRFLIAKRGHDFLLLDIHAARRQLIKTKMSAVTHETPALDRPLLVPVTMPVAAADADLIEKLGHLLSHYGLTLARHAPAAIIIRSIPAILPEVELQPLVRDILAVFKNVQDLQSLHDSLVAVFEAHACDGLPGKMTMNDMQQLLHALAASGCDTGAADSPGVWTTLTIETLARLLSSS
ncbi:MAG: DNA mismatch repair protein mutL, partial [Gammaproteobacteria bacterium]|nr:DNA mismatch repair protein mutL [Gammaproteobacteria bacterium]